MRKAPQVFESPAEFLKNLHAAFGVPGCDGLDWSSLGFLERRADDPDGGVVYGITGSHGC